MKKLVFFIFLTLFMINLSLVYSIYSSESEIPKTRSIERTGDEIFSELTVDNKSYDVQLAKDLREAGIQFNSQDLIDYYGWVDVPLLVEYDSPVAFGAEVPLKGEKKQKIRDLSSVPGNIDKINSIKSVTTSLGGNLKKSYKTIPFVAVKIPKGKLKQLTSNLKDMGKKFYVDSMVRTMLDGSVPLINADDVWTLGYTGEGVKIAILDTGITYRHSDLGGCYPLAVTENCFDEEEVVIEVGDTICKDRDGGLNYCTQSTVFVDQGLAKTTYYDICMDGATKVKEWYCDAAGGASSVTVDCPNGCTGWNPQGAMCIPDEININDGSCAKVIGGYDFVTCNMFNLNTGDCIAPTTEDEDPLDDAGHGTHCTGIAAGTGVASGGTYTGVAPDAELMAVKVLNSQGIGFGSWAISGIEWAVENGADVISMSIGANGEFDGTDPVAQAIDTAVDNGVVVVAAAGNNGDRKSIINTGSAKKAITVGASDIEKPVENDDEISGYSNKDEPLVFGDYYIYSKHPDSWNCEYYPYSPLIITVKDNEGITIESQSIAKSGSEYFFEAKLKITLVDYTCDYLGYYANAYLTVESIHFASDYYLAEFSSRGYTADGRMKPDIIAPGVDIHSTIRRNKYSSKSGTSMATPHVAGAAALLIQAHPDWTPEQIKSAIIITARDIDLEGISLNVLDQGNGGIDAERAVNTLLASSPPVLDFGLVEGGTILTKTFTLTNLHDQDLNLDLSVSGVKNDEEAFPGIASLSTSNLIIGIGSSESVTLTVDTSSLPDYFFYGHVTIIVNGQTYRIPFSFFIKSRMIFDTNLGHIVPTIDGIIEENEWVDANVYSNLGLEGNFDVYLKTVRDGGEDFMCLGIRFKDTTGGYIFDLFFDEGDDGLYGSGTRDYFLRANQEDRKFLSSHHSSRDGYCLGWNDGIWWTMIGYDPHFDFEFYIDWDETYTDLELKMPFEGVEGRGSQWDQSDLNVNYGDSIGFHWGISSYGGWSPLPENSDGSDALTWGTINILCLGDIDGDGDVDMFDFGRFANAYATSMGDPNYNPDADLDSDFDVDMFDFGMFVQVYGKPC